MKTLARNKKPFTYCLYSGTTTPIYDEYGNDTGELERGYDEPVVAWGNISPATGESAVEMFGGLDNYEGLAEGHEKGLAEGHEKGLAEGHEKGLAEGIQAANLENARRMKADNMPVELIAKYTGLTVEVIDSL